MAEAKINVDIHGGGSVARDIGEYVARRREADPGAKFENLDLQLSARLSAKFNDLVGGDRIVAVVYDGPRLAIGYGGMEERPHAHRYHMMVWGEIHEKGRQDRIYIDVDCRREAELFVQILARPELEELRIGLKKTVLHETGHVKLYRSKDTFPQMIARSETMAELYALARLEGSDGMGGERIVAAMGSVLAMCAYIEGNNGSFWGWREGQLAHVDRDRHLQALGLTRHNYLNEGMDDDIVEAAKAYYAKLVKALGEPTGRA